LISEDAKPALKAYTLRKRRKIFDWINDLPRALIAVSAVRTRRQVETAWHLAVETWLQRNGVITITQNKKVLPISPKRLLIIRLPHLPEIDLDWRIESHERQYEARAVRDGYHHDGFGGNGRE
jgi:hypothetical protein